jgi:hypothetical protein
MATATSALRSSVSASIGVPAVNPSLLRDSTMSAPAFGLAMASRFRTGQPVHSAFPTRSPPTSLDTQVRVTRCCSSFCCSSMSQSIVTSCSTSPHTRRDQVAVSSCGTTNAVSIR